MDKDSRKGFSWKSIHKNCSISKTAEENDSST
uniref:Uncharacterized protein n=1 Tax=Rhizophora mucronata TaxID=61149 RepID=A0A2P2QT22_RHIMU